MSGRALPTCRGSAAALPRPCHLQPTSSPAFSFTGEPPVLAARRGVTEELGSVLDPDPKVAAEQITMFHQTLHE